MISNMRDLKCQCCRCYDSFDGCAAFDCQYDFEISLQRVKEVSRESGMSVDTIIALIQAEEDKRRAANADNYRTGNECIDNNNILPEDFNPFYDSQFLISFADSPDLGKRLLVEMNAGDLKRLRAEIDAALKIQEG